MRYHKHIKCESSSRLSVHVGVMLRNVIVSWAWRFFYETNVPEALTPPSTQCFLSSSCEEECLILSTWFSEAEPLFFCVDRDTLNTCFKCLKLALPS